MIGYFSRSVENLFLHYRSSNISLQLDAIGSSSNLLINDFSSGIFIRRGILIRNTYIVE